MIVLYGPRQAPYTEKVRRALVYKGVDFELREPESPEDYKRWSPKTGMLPVLDHHGEHVPDSTDILLRLDQLYPSPPLLAGDAKTAQQQRQLEEWADQSFLWNYMRYRNLLDEEGQLPTARDAALDGGVPGRRTPHLIRTLLGWLRAGGTWERPLTGIHRQLGDRLDDLINFLGARPYFYSERLSMADLGIYAMLFTMRNDSIPGAAELLARRPALVAFMERVEAETGG